MADTVIYKNDVGDIFKHAGYKIGYSCIVCNAASSMTATFWFKEKIVYIVKSCNLVIANVKYCNDDIKILPFNCTAKEFIRRLTMLIEKDANNVFAPSALCAFTDILFTDFASNKEKVSSIMSVLPDFDPEFCALFQGELNDMLMCGSDFFYSSKAV